MITNEEIDVVGSTIYKKIKALREETSVLQIASSRLENIRLLPRLVDIPAVESRQIPDPDNSEAKITLPSKPAHTDNVFDIMPSSTLMGKVLTEAQRESVFASVKKDTGV